MVSIPNDLDSDIRQAHANSDANALVRLYTRLADLKEAAGEIDAACFFLTHAFVYALEDGADEQYAIQERLRGYDREE